MPDSQRPRHRHPKPHAPDRSEAKNLSVYVARTALFNGSGEILLLRRADNDSRRPGDMDLPGGSQDVGESIRQTAAREMAEETGIELPEGKFRLVFAQRGVDGNPDDTLHRFLFIAQVSDVPEVQVRPDEHSSSFWVPPGQLASYFDHPVWVPRLVHLIGNGSIDFPRSRAVDK